MRLWTLLSVALLSAPAFAGNGGVNDERIQAILKARQIGSGMVYRNGKAVLRSRRRCVLAKVTIANSAPEREGLAVIFDGRPLLTNSYGINPQGQIVGNEVFWEAGVYYDPTSAEAESAIPEGFMFSFGQGAQKNSLIVTDKKVELYAKFETGDMRSECKYREELRVSR